MAVGKYIGYGKLFQSRSSGRLNNAHKSNIVGRKLVKFNFQLVHIVRRVVLL